MDRNSPYFPALGRIPSGIFIVTAGSGAEATGMLASWIQQCSFDPPLLSMAMGRDRPMHALLTDGAAFTVNILAKDQTEMIAHFGRGFAPGQPAFVGQEIEQREGFAPILKEALAYLACRVVSRSSPGDHDLFIGQIFEGAVLNEGGPMVHVRKSGAHY